MTEKDRDLMERYIYEVVGRLPKSQRQEIGMELEELIGDMYEAEGSQKSMEEILRELGDPEEFAKQYRDDSKYLISPEYYDDYSWLIQIVMGCIGLSAVVSFLVQLIFGQKGLGHAFGEALGTLVGGGIWGFGIVTLIFAVIERKRVKISIRRNWTPAGVMKEAGEYIKEWLPQQMPPIPDKKSRISRGDCIASIVFIVIFSLLLILFPTFVGMAISTNKGGQMSVVSPFNMEYWYVILPLILVSLALALTDEINKLIAGHYCLRVMLVSLLTGAVQMVIAFILLKGIPFWNPDFAASLREGLNFSAHFNQKLLIYWNAPFLSNLLLFIIMAATILELVTIVYKTVRYGVER